MPCILQVPFVPSTADVLLPPSALSDPRISDILVLLKADSAFPASPFADPRRRAILQYYVQPIIADSAVDAPTLTRSAIKVLF